MDNLDGSSRNFGFTLVEVLMSLFILSFILLGFSGILLQTERHTYDDYYFSMASHQIITMIERLHALGDAEGLDDQIAAWNAQNKLLLPKGAGVIEGSYPAYIVTIYWGKKPYDCSFNHSKSLNCIRAHMTV